MSLVMFALGFVAMCVFFACVMVAAWVLTDWLGERAEVAVGRRKEGG